MILDDIEVKEVTIFHKEAGYKKHYKAGEDEVDSIWINKETVTISFCNWEDQIWYGIPYVATEEVCKEFTRHRRCPNS